MSVINKADPRYWRKEVKHVKVEGVNANLGAYHSYMKPTFEDIAGCITDRNVLFEADRENLYHDLRALAEKRHRDFLNEHEKMMADFIGKWHE